MKLDSMIVKQWIVHFEWWHRKRWFPRLYIYRKPRHGDRVKDGGVMGTLIACQACSGVGLLHEADEIKLPEGMPFPMSSLYPERTCRCINLADDMFPNEHIGDAEAKRRGLMLTTECDIHREI